MGADQSSLAQFLLQPQEVTRRKFAFSFHTRGRPPLPDRELAEEIKAIIIADMPTVAVAPSLAAVATLLAASADQAVNVGLHNRLQHAFGNRSQEIAVAALRGKLGKS